jgi:hypothetical protein
MLYVVGYAVDMVMNQIIVYGSFLFQKTRRKYSQSLAIMW